MAKSDLIDSKYCKDCYDKINLANKLSLQRCSSCHEYFDPSSSDDPYHCSKCVEKMRRCINCHKKFIPDSKIILCPVCYSNIVKTCQICKKDFVPKSRYHNLCPKCHNKIKNPKKSTPTRSMAEDKSAEEKTIELLIKALDDPNNQENAKKTLIEWGNSSIDQIIQNLGTKNKNKRDILIEILCEMKPIAVTKLIQVLNDEYYQEEYFIKTGCVKALGLIGDKRAVETLIVTLDDYDSFVRSSSAKALGLIGDNRAVEPLIDTLENDIDSIVRIASVNALGKFEDINTIKPIVEAMEEEYSSNLTIHCLKTLVDLDEETAVTYLCKNIDNSQKEIAYFSIELLSSLKGDEYVEKILNSCKTRELSKDEFLKLVNNLLNEDLDIRMEAVKLLGDSNNKRASKYLLKLIDDEDNEIRLEVLKSLGKLKNPETLDVLINTLKDRDTSVRWAAEEAIGNFDQEAIPKISESLKSEDDVLRYYLVAILGEIEDVDSETLLLRSLDDPDIDVKIKTIESLAKIGTERSINPLLNLLNDENSKIQRICSYSLVKICEENDLIRLESILENEYQGENKALEDIIKKVYSKIEKIQAAEKCNENESKIQINEPDTTFTTDKKTKQSSETTPPEDPLENMADMGDDPFAILDAIKKK